jgi:hypothetical protein
LPHDAHDLGRMTLLRWAREPFDDYVAGIDAIRGTGVSGLASMAIAAAATWFVYVPLHELLHAWGCLVTGGVVTRLDIAPEYGGAWLATVFPYVHSGSEYAGQLTGFDTHGNDAIHLATVLAPYLLTVLIGVPLLKSVPRAAGMPALLLGVALVPAFAPAISLAGDYYEAGSIVVSRIAHSCDPSIDPARWRSDDVVKLVRSLSAAGAGAVDWIGVACAFAAGMLLALVTYRLGSLLHRVAAGLR